jgi:hypothetical protein
VIVSFIADATKTSPLYYGLKSDIDASGEYRAHPANVSAHRVVAAMA